MRGRLHVTLLIGALSLALTVASGAPRLLALSAAEALAGSGAESPVADAAMRGDSDQVRALLRDGAAVNAAQGDGMTALHWAALGGDLKTMNVLLYAGATADPLTRVGRFT